MYLPTDNSVLVSVINTKLRDIYDSLSDLCDSEDIDEEQLKERLQKAGFSYNETTNQFH